MSADSGTNPARGDASTAHRGLYLMADTHSGRRRTPHPGDVLYWVACLGGACLLLFMST